MEPARLSRGSGDGAGNDRSAIVEVRVGGSADAGGTTIPLAPVEACIDDADVACASIVVAAAPTGPPTSPEPPTQPSTPPSVGPGTGPGAGPGTGGSLPVTGSDAAPLAWMVGMAMLLVGLGIVLRPRRVR